ncbi:MAG: hypothetical protein AAGF95_26435 [Chloroflexota bacterium]
MRDQLCSLAGNWGGTACSQTMRPQAIIRRLGLFVALDFHQRSIVYASNYA